MPEHKPRLADGRPAGKGTKTSPHTLLIDWGKRIVTAEGWGVAAVIVVCLTVIALTVIALTVYDAI